MRAEHRVKQVFPLSEFVRAMRKREQELVVHVLGPDIFQFHCACLRTEICLQELTFSRTLNPNPDPDPNPAP